MKSIQRSILALTAVTFLTGACVAERGRDDDSRSRRGGSGASSSVGGGGGGGRDTACVLQKRELGKTYCADDLPDLWSCPPDEAPPAASCLLSALQSSYCCPAQPSPCVDFCSAFAAACPAGDHSFSRCRDECDDASITYATCDPSPFFSCAADAAYTCLDGTEPRTQGCRAELEAVLACRVQQEVPAPAVVVRSPSYDAYCADLTYGPSTRVLSLGFQADNLPSASFSVDGCENLGGGCDFASCNAMLCCGVP